MFGRNDKEGKGRDEERKERIRNKLEGKNVGCSLPENKKK